MARAGSRVRKPRAIWCALAVASMLMSTPPVVDADVLRGVMRVVSGVFEIPRATLAGTMSGPPILGTVMGALTGAVNGLGLVAGGTLETVTSLVPLALKAAPFIPIFL